MGMQQSTASEVSASREGIRLTVNGQPVTVDTTPETTLLHVIRNVLGLKASRFGCGVGLCGACFVLLEGHATPACDTPMWSAAGREVTTVEGLMRGTTPHPVQQALIDEQAAQCGYCTSGMVISGVALLERNARPSEAEVAEALDRNLCRCGIQGRVLRAVMRASEDPST
jgi:nicotinate dehydrogenase subunit A